MKKTLIAATAAVLCAGAAYAARGPVQAADTDGDGRVSRDEFLAAHSERLERRFSRLDENADGYLSGPELEAAAKRRGGWRRGRPRPERMVSRLDTDGSGGVSFAEIGNAPFAPDADSFYAADRDGNGELDGGEFRELMRSHRPPRHGPRAPGPDDPGSDNPGSDNQG